MVNGIDYQGFHPPKIDNMEKKGKLIKLKSNNSELKNIFKIDIHAIQDAYHADECRRKD